MLPWERACAQTPASRLPAAGGPACLCLGCGVKGIVLVTELDQFPRVTHPDERGPARHAPTLLVVRKEGGEEVS